jgi:hypothetical protein
VIILVWIVGFVLSWFLWLMFANKKRWKEIIPASIFASWLSLIVEAWMHYVYQLWSYSGLAIVALLGNALGVYLVVPYFFIQLLPNKKTLIKMFTYIFFWTSFAILFEFFHWYFLRIEYHLWWNMGCSYIADWIIFGLLYQFHKVFQLEKLSKQQLDRL